MLTRTILATVIVGLTMANAHRAAGDVVRPTPHELAAIAAAEGQRLWFHEEEFRRNPALRAAPHQVVILHLAGASKHQRFLDHAIPYLFVETATYTFCIPKKEPFLQELALTREGNTTPVVQVKQGHKCQTQEITAGLYRLQVRHDGKDIGPDGEKAFIHVPRFKRSLQATSVLGSSPPPSPCYAASALTAPNGTFLTFGADNKVHAGATTVDLGSGASGSGGWDLCSPNNDGYYTLALVNLWNIWSASPLGPTNPTDTSITLSGGSPQTTFRLTDLGNSQFHVFANITYSPAVVVGSDNILHWDASQYPYYYSVPVFTSPAKYYPASAGIPQLQTGEVALFQGCNYDASKGTWVVSADLPNFGALQFTDPSTHTVFRLNDTTQSVQVGPNTQVVLFANTNWGGQPQIISGNVSCLNGTPLGNNTASSIKFESARDFVAATRTCQNCNLTGVDLSGLNLTGGQFTGTTFRSANLVNTDFQSATLDQADFSGLGTVINGTAFWYASLAATNFSEIDSSYQPPNYAFAQFIACCVPTDSAHWGDFLHRTNFTNAKLRVTDIYAMDWRYLNLTGVTFSYMSNFQFWVSYSSCPSFGSCPPPDFSGAIFNGVNLAGVTLDGANFGCTNTVDPTTGTSICTQLKGTDLTSASLKKANLAFALLNGAHLDQANLDGATLCGADLTADNSSSGLSATLYGAFLRNVNLFQANLTGAYLASANFYSTGVPGSCAPSDCGFTTPPCASAVNATMDNADFTGAYLAGVDFGGSQSSLKAAIFTSALLMGSNFDGANLSQNTTSARTIFTGAWLQGATFDNANVSGAIFTNAIIDPDPDSEGVRVQVQLDSSHTTFPGYTPSAGSTLGCVKFTTAGPTDVPDTDSTNTCPDGKLGADSNNACSSAQWQSQSPPLKALPSPASSTCTIDSNWTKAQ